MRHGRWELFGVERWDSYYDQEKGELIRAKTERLPAAGVFVRESDLVGADIFGVYEFPAGVFCTDRVRELIEQENFSNVSFLEMGETF